MNSDVMLNRKLNWLRDNYAQKLLTACSPRKVAANLASLATLYALILICTLTLNPNANAVTCTANTSPLASCTDLTVNQSNLSLVISSGVTINTTSIFSSIFFDGRNGALTGNSLLNNGTLTESNFESSLVLNN